MILGIMQPYFMPYIGYFQLMKAVDKYVVYDDVNYIKGGWVSRNNIIVNGEQKMFTITLKGASSNKLFNEIEIGDDFHKFEKTLKLNYSKAIYFDTTMDLLKRIFSYPEKHLEIETEILLSSELSKDNSLKGKERVFDICHLLQANRYYNAIGGEKLYDKLEFEKHGIHLNFLDTIVKEYRQMSKTFIPNLSIIDVLMNNSKEEIHLLLDSYKLK